jgi:hypothetical protein
MEIILNNINAKACGIFKIYRSTFWISISQLFELGFIDIAHHGGGMMKGCSKYGISERWKYYAKDVFIEKSYFYFFRLIFKVKTFLKL